MKTVEEYLRHAAECDALARKAVSAEQREMIAHMADTWRLLARQRQQIILEGGPPAEAQTVAADEATAESGAAH